MFYRILELQDRITVSFKKLSIKKKTKYILLYVTKKQTGKTELNFGGKSHQIGNMSTSHHNGNMSTSHFVGNLLHFP